MRPQLVSPRSGHIRSADAIQLFGEVPLVAGAGIIAGLTGLGS